DWKRALRLLVDRCSAKTSALAYDFDISVVTALGSPEYAAVVNGLPIVWAPEAQLSQGAMSRIGTVRIGGGTVKVSCTHASSMGLVAATDLSGKVINEYRARILAMTGFCGGIGVQIGDLVGAEKAWDWQSGKHLEGEFHSSVDQKDASPQL